MASLQQFITGEIRMTLFGVLAASVNGSGGIEVFTGPQVGFFANMKVNLHNFYIRFICPTASFVGYAAPHHVDGLANKYGAFWKDPDMTFLELKEFIRISLERVLQKSALFAIQNDEDYKEVKQFQIMLRELIQETNDPSLITSN